MENATIIGTVIMCIGTLISILTPILRIASNIQKIKSDIENMMRNDNIRDERISNHGKQIDELIHKVNTHEVKIAHIEKEVYEK